MWIWLKLTLLHFFSNFGDCTCANDKDKGMKKEHVWLKFCVVRENGKHQCSSGRLLHFIPRIHCSLKFIWIVWIYWELTLLHLFSIVTKNTFEVKGMKLEHAVWLEFSVVRIIGKNQYSVRFLNVKCHPNDLLLQHHNNLNHVNQLRIDIAAHLFHFRRLPEKKGDRKWTNMLWNFYVVSTVAKCQYSGRLLNVITMICITASEQHQ